MMEEYCLVWQDDFDYEGPPDPAKWNYDVGFGGWGNNESQCYTNRAQNACVKGGRLIIRAFRENFGGARYTSARLTTFQRAEWQYGKIEVCAKLPRGAGSWPAIWMLPTGVIRGDDWPMCGEIDIMEHVGKDENVVHASLHSALYNHMLGTQRTHFEPLERVTERFHNYAMEWTPEAIRFLYDGREVNSFAKGENGSDTTKAGWPFDQSFCLILNIAVGGNWGGPVDEAFLPYVMEVEHVRVYQRHDLHTGAES